MQPDAVAITALPGRFAVLLENRHVRVVECTFSACERDERHTRPPKASYVNSGAQFRIPLADGRSFLGDEAQGTVACMNALRRNYAENVATTPLRVPAGEVKPSDGRRRVVRAS